MDKLVVVFIMDGCALCDRMKNQLEESDVGLIERDIHSHSEEYELFVEATGSEFVPAFMIIEDAFGEPKSTAYVPDKDYMTIEEGVEIIKKSVL